MGTPSYGLTVRVRGTEQFAPGPLLRAAAAFALRVAADMGLRPGRADFFWARFAADTYGGDWRWDNGSHAPDGNTFGWFEPDTGAIYLNRARVRGKEQAAEVLCHELTHRFLRGERYADAWEPGWEQFDPAVFQECIALIVGVMVGQMDAAPDLF